MTYQNYSAERNEDFLNEMVEFYGGIENLPNPNHYPIRFEFLTKSFEHYKKMQEVSINER